MFLSYKLCSLLVKDRLISRSLHFETAGDLGDLSSGERCLDWTVNYGDRKLFADFPSVL